MFTKKMNFLLSYLFGLVNMLSSLSSLSNQCIEINCLEIYFCKYRFGDLYDGDNPDLNHSSKQQHVADFTRGHQCFAEG